MGISKKFKKLPVQRVALIAIGKENVACFAFQIQEEVRLEIAIAAAMFVKQAIRAWHNSETQRPFGITTFISIAAMG